MKTIDDIETLDRLFDEGEVDVIQYFDFSQARRPGLERLRGRASAPIPSDGAGRPILKLTAQDVATLAAKLLQDRRSSKLQKQLAATALTQLEGPRPLDHEDLDPAVHVLSVEEGAASIHYADSTRSLAAWVMEHATWDHWNRAREQTIDRVV